jgi:exopolysaccharide biosynthesis WecB/TagA/CpsF family protein
MPPSPASLPIRPFLGLRFVDADLDAVAASLAERPAEAPFGYVVTPNADHLIRLDRDPSLAALYRQALLRLLDSRVVGGLARVVGLPPPPVVTGSDLSAQLLRAHVGAEERVTIVGLAPGLVPALAARCGLARLAHFDPPQGFDRDPGAFAATVEFVLTHPARFTFLAVGSPRQERLAAAIQATGRAKGTGLCIGASLEFLAGSRRRAPVWMQHAGLEWLHRLASDPRRLARRYLWDGPAIVPLLWRARREAEGRLLPAAPSH